MTLLFLINFASLFGEVIKYLSFCFGLLFSDNDVLLVS